MTRNQTFSLLELGPYINWIYFFHAWNMPPRFAAAAQVHDCPACRQAFVASFGAGDREQAREAVKLHADAVETLRLLSERYNAYGRFALYPAESDGDDLLVAGHRIALLRQQHVARPGAPFLCLSDYVRPVGAPPRPGAEGRYDIGLFATTVDGEMEHLYDDDPYRRMLVQTLCDRLAEAAAEKLHEAVRKEHWGYAPDEHFSPQELFSEKYQGIRPAIGYPSLPDQSLIFQLDELLDMGNIGIRLTSSGAMSPHASVAGLMMAHPQATYFAVGRIGEDQLADYARRRGIPAEKLRKFLTANLS